MSSPGTPILRTAFFWEGLEKPLQRSPAEALAWLAEHAEASGFLPPGHGATEMEHRFAAFAASHRAMTRYRGGPCAAPCS